MNDRWIKNGLAIGVVVTLSTLPILLRSAHAQNCGHLPIPPGVEQLTGAWCAFACLEYVADELGHGYYQQCDFVGEAARSYYRPLAPDCISPWMACNTYACESYFLYGGEYDDAMNAMGFEEYDFDDIHWYPRPASPNDLIGGLCDGDYLILANAPLGSAIGNSVVVCWFDASLSVFVINNPNWDPPLFPTTYSELLTGTYPGGDGDLLGFVRVGSFSPAFVGIGHIGGFWGWTEDDDEVRLSWRLNHGTNPADSMALYVADNPAGPARKAVTIKPLEEPPPDGGTTGGINHETLPAADMYYYWIAHGSGNFASVWDPAEGVYPNSNNPIDYQSLHDPRDVLDPPNITQIVDPQLNNGDELFVHWELSTNDAMLDYYNVYRDEGQGFRWIGSAPRGTASFRDTTVFPGAAYAYRVSAAHHGASGGPVSAGNRGIWNDFGEPVSATATSDFPVISSFVREHLTGVMKSMPESPAVGCPQGDHDEIVVEVRLGAVGGAVSCPPADALTLSQPTNGIGCQPCDPSALVFYQGVALIHADSAAVFVPADPTVSNAHCITTFTVSAFGGCGLDSALVSAWGVPLGYAYLNVKSPDVAIAGSSHAKVDLFDFTVLGASYTSPPKPYNACVDYEPTIGAVNMSDFAAFGAHWEHAAPGGGSASEVGSSVVSGTVVLDFDEDHPLLGEHVLRATVSLEGVPSFRAAMFVLRNENPKLEFTSWVGSSGYDGETISTEAIRDGHREVFIGVLDEDAAGGDVTLGTAEFRVVSDQQLTLTDGDLALVTADLLSSTDQRSTLAFNSLAVRRSVTSVAYKNELAQNYPNPFNPTTTISFSLAQAADASLSIYDVRGALVKTLHNGRKERGIHRIVWDGTSNNAQSAASGVYFYKLVAGSFTDTKKMTILK